MATRTAASKEITIPKAAVSMVRQPIPLIPGSAILFPVFGGKFNNKF